MERFHGVEADRLARVGGRPGYGVSIAVAGQDLIETYCSGTGRFARDFPVRPDMLFQAGSVSKPMFALTLLRYADRGMIDLDADISGTVREYARSPVTFSALLSHTAGFNVRDFPGYRPDAPRLSAEDVLAGRGNTAKLRRIRPCGKQHMYSGGGITLAELAFTRLADTTLRDAFQKEVAEPLGLTRTGFFQPLDEDLVPDAAFGGRLGVTGDPAHGYRYYPELAAAGLWSTPSELAKVGIELGRCIRRGGLLRKETAARMLSPVMDGYGLCIENIGGAVGFHGGWNEGYLTKWMFSLREDLCVACMVNRSTHVLSRKQREVTDELFRVMEGIPAAGRQA